MSPELAEYVQIGAEVLGDSFSRPAWDKVYKEKLLDQRKLEESYRERILGPGLGGGFSGHLMSHYNPSSLKYFMPALYSGLMAGTLLLFNNDYDNDNSSTQKDAEKSNLTSPEVGATKNSALKNNTNLDLMMQKVRGLKIEMPPNNPIAAAGSGNPPVTNTLGMNSTGSPVGMAWPNLLMGSEGMDAGQLANTAQTAMMFAKKGTKLIPRQK